MNPYSISMIHTQLTNAFKVKHGSILIEYYKSHGRYSGKIWSR